MNHSNTRTGIWLLGSYGGKSNISPNSRSNNCLMNNCQPVGVGDKRELQNMSSPSCCLMEECKTSFSTSVQWCPAWLRRHVMSLCEAAVTWNASLVMASNPFKTDFLFSSLPLHRFCTSQKSIAPRALLQAKHNAVQT